MKIGSWFFKIFKSAWFWIIVWVLLVVIATSVISFVFWDDLKTDDLSSTIRNIVLAAAAVIALPLAIWRSIVAERQVDTAQQGLLNERYQKGAEMLGNEVLTVRLGGIYALMRLAEEHPEQYHIPIIKLFCAFVRNPTENEDDQDDEEREYEPRSVSTLRVDIQAVLDAIGRRSEAGLVYEKATQNFRLELQGVDLRGASLYKANLSGANLCKAYLVHANLNKANLSGANMIETNLYSAKIDNANLSHTKLDQAILTKTSAQGINLSQAELGTAGFSNADLQGANLSQATIGIANYTDANLTGANLSHAKIMGTDFRNAILQDACLSGTVFEKGFRQPRSSRLPEEEFPLLTQTQLDGTKADPDNPPKIDKNIVDSETRLPLRWSPQSE